MPTGRDHCWSAQWWACTGLSLLTSWGRASPAGAHASQPAACLGFVDLHGVCPLLPALTWAGAWFRWPAKLPTNPCASVNQGSLSYPVLFRGSLSFQYSTYFVSLQHSRGILFLLFVAICIFWVPLLTFLYQLPCYQVSGWMQLAVILQKLYLFSCSCGIYSVEGNEKACSLLKRNWETFLQKNALFMHFENVSFSFLILFTCQLLTVA